MINIKQQLSACLKQTTQMEQEAQSLGLTPSEQVRLAALLRSAKEALEEAEKMIPQKGGGGQQTEPVGAQVAGLEPAQQSAQHEAGQECHSV